MKRSLLLIALAMNSWLFAQNSFDYDVYVQRTYNDQNSIKREYLPYHQADEVTSLSRSAQLESEEVIEIYTWFGDADTFAMATIKDRESYEAYINGSLSRNSPQNLNRDIPWQGSYNYNNIAAAFNHGRAEENNQINNDPELMKQPSVEGNELSLYLANDDRSSRGVLPFSGIDAYVTEIAEAHRDDMLENNFFAHTGSDGRSPFARIDNHPVIGNGMGPGGINCHEFLPRGENLAAFWTSGTSIPLARARSQYNFVYHDAGSAWGHRECSLLGDTDLNGRKGFTNNHGDSGSEGLVGFALGGSTSFNPFNMSWVRYGEVFVFNMIDPVPQCEYSDATVSEFTSFTAEVVDSVNVKLSWTCPDLSTTTQFSIEQSSDNTNWTSITKIDPTAANDYIYTVQDLSPSSYYFRIIKLKEDQSTAASPIRQVKIEDQNNDDSGDDTDSNNDPGSLAVRIVNGSLVIDTKIDLLVAIVNSQGQTNNINYSPGDSIRLSNLRTGVYIILIKHAGTGQTLKAIRLFVY